MLQIVHIMPSLVRIDDGIESQVSRYILWTRHGPETLFLLVYNPNNDDLLGSLDTVPK